MGMGLLEIYVTYIHVDFMFRIHEFWVSLSFFLLARMSFTKFSSSLFTISQNYTRMIFYHIKPLILKLLPFFL